MYHQQIEFYKNNGYAVFSEFFNDEELLNIKKHVDYFISNIVHELPSNQVYYDDLTNKKSLKQIQKIFEYDSFFDDLINKSKIYRITQILLGEKPKSINLQYFDKPPKFSKPTPPHQDGYYFKIKPLKAITLWLALDDVDEKNGGVKYYPRSHLEGLRTHLPSGILGFSQGIPNDEPILKESKGVFVPCSAGTLLAHDALTIHCANKNETNRSRKSLGFIYYASSVKINEMEASIYQNTLDHELKEKGFI